ncbi:hypothetical protein K502DRAFT_368399 [Neoconidiobolus thromboides FSU 785]|nr:hypothetical protein K502DRAFT_368399 [Neoconidiobolus thromboides FSU 785]
MTEEEIRAMLPSISNGLNSLSIASSLLVLSLFTITALFRPDLVNRTTLRLQVAISAIDFLNSTFALFHHTVKSGPFCIFIGFWRNYGEEIYCFFNIMIALNLQLVFIHKKTPSRKWEYFYWGFPITLAAILSFIPLGMGLYGLNGGDVCFIKEQLPEGKVLVFVNASLVFFITFLYLIVIATIVNIKLARAKSDIDLIADNDNIEVNENFRSNLKKMIFRISLYPIFCIFGLSGFCVSYINLASGGSRKLGISIWGMVGVTTKGFFNMITFFLDTTFQEAFISTYRLLFNKKDVIDHSKEFDFDLTTKQDGAFISTDTGHPSTLRKQSLDGNDNKPIDLKKYL